MNIIEHYKSVLNVLEEQQEHVSKKVDICKEVIQRLSEGEKLSSILKNTSDNSHLVFNGTIESYILLPKKKFRPYESFEEAKVALGRVAYFSDDCKYLITGVTDTGFRFRKIFPNGSYAPEYDKGFLCFTDYVYEDTKQPIGVVE